jgi:serine protease Do
MTSAILSAGGVLATHAVAAAELEALADCLRDVTVRIGTSGGRFDGVGAGVLWPIDGRRLVITNAHVVSPRRGDDVIVESATGLLTDGHLIARSAKLDLALLSLPDLPDEWPQPASLGDARSLRVGQIVVALGHPFGVGGALSLGVIHAAPNGDENWVQADIRLAPGNSGGPLATLEGAVVGINCMIARGLGIAIPAHVADRFAREAAAR